jgi:3'-5' exoribonuclease
MADPKAQPALADLEAGGEICGTYRLKQCLLRQTPQGKAFILGEIADGSGSLGLVWWHAAGGDHEVLRLASYVRLEGKAERYRDRLQLVVGSMQAVDAAEVDTLSLEPPTRCDPVREWADLLALIDSLRQAQLQALLRSILVEDGELAARFRVAPAAVSMHHPWTSGLLAHTVQMARIADGIASLYPRLDRDLLIAAVLLHDLCKIDEISSEGSYDYTTVGNLIGHVVLGSQLVFDRARQIEGFPQRLLEKLQHCILSHHGQPEWGAAREPRLPEAFVLHYIDNIDARLEAAFRAIDTTTAGDAEWTEFNRMLGVRVYRGD